MTSKEIKEALEWSDAGPIANYHLILYINESFEHCLANMKKLLAYDMVVYSNMRPPMGYGNF
ncbi:MAG TPA: hypothetical protein DDW17_07730 [Deltaproteobacteria bacterium]|nr:hypothetical protein [Deltaproteobacteria bacterium]